MLKKLFRHEWKDCWKTVGIINLIVLVFSFCGTLFFNKNMFEMAENNEYVAIALVLYIVLYFTAIMALALSTSFYFYYRFYKNMYTDEGYLMHTLPVNPHQLIWSKSFVALIWQMISSLVMAFSLINFFDCIMRMDTVFYEQSLWVEIFKGIQWFFANEMKAYMIPLAIIFILCMLIAPFFSIFMGYTAISLGQCTKKHKIMAAVGIYFGLMTLIQTVSSFASVPLGFFIESINVNSQQDMIMYMTLMFAIMVLIIAGATALLYFLTYNVMKNKLNLE